MLALALISGIYALQYNILLQPIPHDTTFHIYAAQQILDGHAIYRDVAIVKAPLADFATALMLIFSRMARITDISGARVLSLLVVMASASATYLAGRVLFRSRIVGIVAGLVMAGWDFYGLRAVTGPEPKAFLILFAMLSLVCIAQQRWVWAGVCAALTTLAWQPGLMVAAFALGGALVAPWLGTERRSGTEQRPFPTNRQSISPALQNAVRVVLGFAAPFVLVLIYLVANGALFAAWNATIGANLDHLNQTTARTPLSQLIVNNIALIAVDARDYCFSPSEDWLIVGGTLGFAGILAGQLLAAARTRRVPIDLERTPYLLYGLGFAAFTLIDFDFCPDLFPLLPILAIGVGWLVWTGSRELAKRVPQVPRAEAVFGTIAVLIIAAVYLLDARSYQLSGTTFFDQLAVAQTAQKYLQSGDRIQAFGDTIVPIELHMQNVHKILHLGSKSGLGVLASEPGGVAGMISALEVDPPKLITLSRETRPTWTKPFYDWLTLHYRLVEYFPRANIRFFVRKK